jgi:hypothetical protein
MVGVSTLVACGLVWHLIERRVVPPPVPVAAPAAAEELLDGLAVGQIAGMMSGESRYAHRIIAVLDPASRDVSRFASEISHLAAEPDLRADVMLLFAPKGNPSAKSPIGDILALECGRRQGQLLQLLDALDRYRGTGKTDWTMVATKGNLDPSIFSDCVRRRETAAKLADGLILVRRLRLIVRPGFVFDNTVIRGRISVDSLRVRLQARR